MSRKIFSSDKEDSYALEARVKRAFGTNNLKAIAIALHISYPGLNHFLRGHRRLTVDLVKRMSDLTGYSIHWLVTGEGPEKVIVYGISDLDHAVQEIVSEALAVYKVKREKLSEEKEPRNTSAGSGRKSHS